MTVGVFKTCVALGNEIHYVDTIEFEGKFWLVPQWLDNPARGVTTPARMISLATIPHQQFDQGPWKFVLNNPLPKSLFDLRPQTPTAPGYEVLDLPDIPFPIPRGTN